jgi:uncharacterized protein YlaN (UPF0358 family)
MRDCAYRAELIDDKDSRKLQFTTERKLSTSLFKSQSQASKAKM